MWDNFYNKRDDKYKCIFRVIKNSIEHINHNINLFEDYKADLAFKNYILNGISFKAFDDCEKIELTR